MNLINYWPEFIVFAFAHILSLISPGPDFLMVVRSSLRYRRSSAYWVAFGISCGECVHVGYSLAGIGLLISQSLWLFSLLKYLGGAYLIYIGIQSLRARKEAPELLLAESRNAQVLEDPSAMKAFSQGFLTNVLNAKAAFFTISFFTVLVSPETPFVIQLGYGIFIQLSTLGWFLLVASFLTHQQIQGKFLGMKHWIERTAGSVLIVLGIKLALSDINSMVEG